MKLPTRKFLLRFVIFSLSVTAVLGITGVLASGLGETGAKILGSAILADAASFLALCCSGRVTSAWQRAVQVTGIVSAGLGLVTAQREGGFSLALRRLAEDFPRWSDLDDLAEIHHRDPIGEVADHRKVV